MFFIEMAFKEESTFWTIEGFGPFTIIGVMKDVMNNDGTMSFDGKAIEKITVSSDVGLIADKQDG